MVTFTITNQKSEGNVNPLGSKTHICVKKRRRAAGRLARAVHKHPRNDPSRGLQWTPQMAHPP